MKVSNDSTLAYRDRLQNHTLHRSQLNPKKRRSWVSFVLTLIALVLSAIAAFHMYYHTLFKIHFLDQTVNYQQFKDVIQNLTHQSLIDTRDLESNLNMLLTMINIFFILIFINIVLAILTLVFNRTFIKLLNLIIAVCATLIPIAILYIVREAAKTLASKFEPYLGHVNPSTLLAESNGLHNAIIFSSIATLLYFVSLFFRNRRPKR
ncbi:hypothetical protein MTQ89_09180 [Staphylococcus hyicus]|uniref:hypothetical protein n=1 Tax=Staphylococcus hyicus TaxID=1284 RepID=UPI00208E66BE|nr:hypothetical protein [Staphylococcus hyicus]MCO4328848.1 hypothetical protein [Staphylococcus hyicus]MCO4336910.1 hypothetical protein [Staphylococcus hyicus]